MSTSRRAPKDGGDDAVIEVLVRAAIAARKHAYAPYSRYRVGAAVLTKTGKIFTGCNVENASYGATMCAERNAIGAMVAGGESSAVACVVVTSGAEPGSPCGICRQVLAEFAKDLRIVLVGEGARGALVRRETTLAALLPEAFRIESLGDVSPLHARPARRRAAATPRRRRRIP